jgi:hypothetical protein
MYCICYYFLVQENLKKGPFFSVIKNSSHRIKILMVQQRHRAQCPHLCFWQFKINSYTDPDFRTLNYFCSMLVECRQAAFLYCPLILKVQLLKYWGADKSLARPPSRYIFLMVRILLLMLIYYVYINSTNIPPIMIINRIYESQNLLSL